MNDLFDDGPAWCPEAKKNSPAGQGGAAQNTLNTAHSLEKSRADCNTSPPDNASHPKIEAQQPEFDDSAGFQRKASPPKVTGATKSDGGVNPTNPRQRSSRSEQAPTLISVNAADIQPEATTWLWDGWVARGKLHILAGAPGTGKTTIAMSLAAAFSSGGKLPDGTTAPRTSVLIMSLEDGIADTLVPRLSAAGADRARVHFANAVTRGKRSRLFSFGADVDALKAFILEKEIGLIIIDPVVAVLGPFDSHRNAETRLALQPIADLVESMGVAVIGITHLSKGAGDRTPLERVSGSLAFGAVPRLVLIASARRNEDGEDERLLVRAKSNLGPDTGGFIYEVTTREVSQGVVGSCIDWKGAVDGEARDLLRDYRSDAKGGSREEILDFVRQTLAEGPVEATQFKEMAQNAGYGWRTVQRYAKQIGASPRKTGSGPWVWSFPVVVPKH